MLKNSWRTGELIDQLAATQQAFGYTGLSGPTPPLNQPQPTADTTCNPPDDILSKKPEPKNIQYGRKNTGTPQLHFHRIKS